MVFEPRRSNVADFVLNGAVVERGKSYKYLGFVFHATKRWCLNLVAVMLLTLC